jgi:hypothetical protein
VRLGLLRGDGAASCDGAEVDNVEHAVAVACCDTCAVLLFELVFTSFSYQSLLRRTYL